LTEYVLIGLAVWKEISAQIINALPSELPHQYV